MRSFVRRGLIRCLSSRGVLGLLETHFCAGSPLRFLSRCEVGFRFCGDELGKGSFLGDNGLSMLPLKPRRWLDGVAERRLWEADFVAVRRGETLCDW